MEHQEVLKKVRSQMELPENVADMAEKLSDSALTLLASENISFEEYSQIGFLSHLFNMTGRMHRNEHLAPIDEDVMTQLESEPLRIAARVAELWQKWFDSSVDDAECALIAIHLQTALMKQNKQKEGVQHG